jgi:endonuclease YncB( thermonuclease family)
MATLAFVLLIAALVLFIVSTRQWAIWIRGCVWGGGLLLLLLGWFALGNSERDPELARAVGDFFANIGNPGESLLFRVLGQSRGVIGQTVLSLFDIFVVLGIFVAILALIAFSPGEAMEKVIRPIMAGMIGAVVGCLLALAVVGAGFGWSEELNTYEDEVGPATVLSGDELWLNRTIVQMRGIEAPEPEQICRFNRDAQQCGDEATRALRRILEGTYVTCTRAGEVSDDPRAVRYVTCQAQRQGGRPFDVAARIVQEGYAANEGQGGYQQEAAEARTARRGMTQSCVLRPAVWKGLSAQRRSVFERTGDYRRGERWEAFGSDRQCPTGGRQGERQLPPTDAPE